MDGQEFWDFVLFGQEDVNKHDLPHRTKLVEEIFTRYKAAQLNIKEDLLVSCLSNTQLKHANDPTESCQPPIPYNWHMEWSKSCLIHGNYSSLLCLLPAWTKSGPPTCLQPPPCILHCWWKAWWWPYGPDLLQYSQGQFYSWKGTCLLCIYTHATNTQFIDWRDNMW